MLPDNQPIGVDQCNCFTLRKAARQISRFYDAHLQQTGLRITQFLILTKLRLKPTSNSRTPGRSG
jgi:hypothetical protein